MHSFIDSFLHAWPLHNQIKIKKFCTKIFRSYVLQKKKILIEFGTFSNGKT